MEFNMNLFKNESINSAEPVGRHHHRSSNLLFGALASVLLFCCATINAKEYDATSGEVVFSGEHAGVPFSGVFESWSADVVLPPEASAGIKAEFDLSSATTGDSMYDSTLPEYDWFNTDDFPTGTFESTSIEDRGNGEYLVSGDLTIKGISRPVEFVLSRSGDSLTSEFTINRIDYNIGVESDPDAEWVSEDIEMTLTLD